MLSGTLRVKQGQVVDVNRLKWTCTVKFDDGTPEEAIPVAPIYVNKGGQGIYYFPEEGSMVVVAFVSDKRFILATSYPIDEDKPINSVEDAKSDGDYDPAHNAKRPILDPGDYSFSTKGGGFLLMRAGGVVEVGASQVSRRFYIPINNFIRDLCAAYELNTAGGQLQFLNRVGDPSHGTVSAFVKQNPSDPDDVPQEMTFSKSPIEFNLNLKEYAEDDEDIIQLSMGRIKENDGDNSPLLGSPADDFNLSALIRFNVNDRMTYFLDKFGTVIHTVSGAATLSYKKSYRLGIKGNKTEEVVGNSIQSLGSRKVTVKSTDELDVNGDVTELIQGKKTTTIKGKHIVQVSGKTEKRTQGEDITVEGSSKQVVTGDRQMTTAGNFYQNVGEETKIIHANNFEISGTSGDFDVVNFLGDITLQTKVGKSSLKYLEVAEVSVNVARAKMTYKGGSALELNASGSQLATSGGSVTVMKSGAVRLGSNSGAGGYVITTTTNPVCFVTGLPLMGAKNVVVKSTAPTPSTVPITPSTFVKSS